MISAKEINNSWGGVLDSSAMLAWLFREPGGTEVESVLPAMISSVNLTEVLIVGVRRGLNAEMIQEALLSLPITVVSYEQSDAPAAAILHTKTREYGLSLADCICISLGAKHDLPVLTADSQWVDSKIPAKIRLIR